MSNLILAKILSKADYLDETKCKENHGYFLKLTKNEERILLSKIRTIPPEEIDNHPKIKYNKFFIDFTKKLKSSYLEKLSLLVKILEKIKEMPIINNTELNLISRETKKHIDEMYNTCHYYYIYAIISLINADIVEQIPTENLLGTHMKELVKNK